MQGNSFGKAFTITTFGESHGKAIGVIIDGVPSKIPITEAEIQTELDRRRPGQSAMTTPRQESDTVHILSGIMNHETTGAPAALMINNMDADPSKYEPLKEIYRPGHADFTYEKKYGIRDYRGGGRSSGRETATRVAAGAIAKKILSLQGISIKAYTIQIGDIIARDRDFKVIEKNPLRCPDLKTAKAMELRVNEVRGDGDSIGGVVECTISGIPVGLGEPVFDKLDADLAKAVMSIGAVKGFEIGSGFESAKMKGSEHNDIFTPTGSGETKFMTNHAGGVLGGISNGDEIVFRVAVKPPSSIRKPQETITKQGKKTEIVVEGRHDPVLCPRIVPVVEAMSAIVILDHLLRQKAMTDS